MAETQNTFKCVLISPAGKLLDCKASSIIFTARDGSMGVLYNHTPMLCELGVGFMEITAESENNGGGNKKIFVDRGFALISSNLVNIIADDAICMWNTTKEKIELLIEKSKKKIQAADMTSHQRWLENRKIKFLQEMLASVK